ncbi:restriction endonuclease [Alkalihalophilus pseudofirmus]|uniref:Restriction endonuclease n=1 Tax=Alkalihalophilus pseudofirmus TaxID=79885 RepID=A0AAJ2NNB5_ALKPS|nr:restriction endonuclease [Alkalihalophilus pseudofirmus]MDV2885521.1 restriction endonuclease [Alkalihalophilus pseudofirmus]
MALLHSNIVKYNATGGLVVTTAGFNKNAVKYASDLNIRLISGQMLVEMWLQEEEFEVEYIKNIEAF